jgi:signal transduction histidine kinase
MAVLRSQEIEQKQEVGGAGGPARTVAEDVAAIGRIGAVQRILEVVCQTTGMGFSAVARVTETQWIACAVRDEINFGLKPGGELEIRTTICDEIRQSRKLVVIDHVAEDCVFRDHHTPRKYGFQSYISVPIIRPSGEFFGTLCAIDPRPARLNSPQVIGMFTLFADLIAQHLDSQERMDSSEAALLTERETAQLREQFIAVLGHDLRNPLAAIRAAAHLLGGSPDSTKLKGIAELISRSAVRMNGLITNILDFARGRLGGGLTLHFSNEPNLASMLEQVIGELEIASAGRVIRREISIPGAVRCDTMRLGQLLSNLVGNAIAHGDPQSPILVRASLDGGRLEMSVTNRGRTIPPHVASQLFQPFFRGVAAGARKGQDGLGLGLYIAAEIARAHGGALQVASADGETRFTFAMPVMADPGAGESGVVSPAVVVRALHSGQGASAGKPANG